MQKRNILAGLAILIASGCTQLTQSQLEDRRYPRAEYRAHFLEFRTACWQQDKRIFIDARHTPPKLGIPHRGDRYFCY